MIERELECGERFNTANAFRQEKDVLYHNSFVNVLCGSPARIAWSSAPENGTAATKLCYTMANSLEDVSSLACFTACDRGSAEWVLVCAQWQAWLSVASSLVWSGAHALPAKAKLESSLWQVCQRWRHLPLCINGEFQDTLNEFFFLLFCLHSVSSQNTFVSYCHEHTMNSRVFLEERISVLMACLDRVNFALFFRMCTTLENHKTEMIC